MKTRVVIGIDPSGAYKEGSGTTGFYVIEKAEDQPRTLEHFVVQAEHYPSRMYYWTSVIDHIEALVRRHEGAVVSVEDYVLYATAAKAQINSEMETSKLIGAIMVWCHLNSVPLYMRTASLVMKRWANHIIEHKGIIEKQTNRWRDTTNGELINHHALDALRHALHCVYFEYDKQEKRVK